MKALAALIMISTYGWAQCPSGQSGLRFRISENNRFGFIDETGSVVIAAQFYSAQEFSEGSAAVRIDGKFGYINTDGSVCIAPKYDYALPFENGLALVYLNGKPLFINVSGEKAFESNYASMSRFIDGKSYVKTITGKSGVIDFKGDLLVDTIYQHIEQFKDGLAVVYGLNHEKENADESETHEVSVIDTKGKLLLPFGAYHEIQHNASGYFEASRPVAGKKNDWEYHLYKERTLVYLFPQDKGHMTGPVSNGILRLLTDKHPGGGMSSDDLYDRYIKPNGKKVFQNTDGKYGSDFKEYRAFIEIDNKVCLIDTTGRILGKNLGSRYSDQGFENGKALVKDTNGWNVIDLSGKVVLTTPYEEVYEFLHDDLLFFTDNENEDAPCYGVMDMSGKVLIPPSMQYFNPTGFDNGLLWGYVNNRLRYYDLLGKVVWQEADNENSTQGLNIDYMNRGYFYVTYDTVAYEDKEESISSDYDVHSDAVTVVANPKRICSSSYVKNGFEVYIANTTSDKVWFNAQDRRLYMKIQARDLQGTWRDIEYLPSSWCGNSYHSISLSKGKLWKFTAPFYQGMIPTKLRIQVQYIDASDITAEDREGRYRNKKQITIYSNEFDGSINPAQFWRKPEYYPGGIMDPYFD